MPRRDCPTAEAALERTRLLGSPAAAGLGEAVFRMEAERPVAGRRAALEHRLEGRVHVRHAPADRDACRCSGKADRIDLLADGTFRVIDYKLGWPPEQGTRAAAADLRLVRGAEPGGPSRTAVDARRGGLSRVQRSEAGGRRSSTSPQSETKVLARRAAAAGRRGRRDRARPVSADAGRCVSLRDVQRTRRSAARTTSVTTEMRSAFRATR